MKLALTRSTRQLQQQQRAGMKRPKQRMSRRKRPIQGGLQGAEILPHRRHIEQVEVQIYSLVKEEPGLTQERSPRQFQIGQNLTLDERSVQ